MTGWEPFIDRLMRTEKCEVYITGSSAQMLSREIATQTRGRALSWEMFPFSFREFLDFKAAVSDYLAWFEDAHVLFTVRIFDASLARANINPKKIYCIDHALVTSTSSGILVNTGHLLENLVFTALRRTTPEIFYFKTKSGREVDFVVQEQDRSHTLVQVCESMVDPQTRKREITALNDAMAELKLPEGTIVTRSEDEQLHVPSGKINVVPAWRFVLNVSAT